MATRLQKVFEAKVAESFSSADAAANHSEESDFGDSDSDDERGRKLQQIQKKVFYFRMSFLKILFHDFNFFS
jgi:hypothetical protein